MRFQISHPQRLINDRAVLVSNPNSTFMYTVIDLARNQDIKLGFNSTTSEATGVIGKLYIMPFLPDFATDLNKFKSYDIDTENDIDLSLESENNHIGRNYYLVQLNDMSWEVKVTTLVNNRIQLSAITSIKMDGSGPAYTSTKLLENTQTQSSLVLKLRNCDNCAICIGYEATHPRLDPFVNSTKDETDCIAIVGQIKSELDKDPAERTYQTEALVPANSGQGMVYATIISLDAEGITEQVDFTIDQLLQVSPDTVQSFNMKSNDLYEDKDENGEYFYSSINLNFRLRCADLAKYNQSTFSVAPDLSNEKVQVMNYITAFYTVFASVDSSIPSYSDSQYMVNDEMGIAILTFNNSDLNASCPANAQSELVSLFVQVRASASLTDITPTRFLLSMKNSEDVAHPLAFSDTNYISMNKVGKRSIFYFNVQARPIRFTLSPCRGRPMMRVGMTDFYLRSTYNSTDFNESKERVWRSNYEDYQFGEDIIFQVVGGSKYNAAGDYMFEVGDWRSVDSIQYWSADFYAGNSDPRPGVPVRKFELGYDSDFEVRFSPGISLGKNQGQPDLEYSFYILPLYEDQSNYFNPNQACGFRQGGFQMVPWTTFSEYADKFILYADYNKSAYDEFVQNNPKAVGYAAAVLVRQKDTGLMNSYKYEMFQPDDLPGPLDMGSSSSTIIGIICGCVAGVVVIGLAVWLTIFLVRRKRQQNPYEFVKAEENMQ